MPTTKLYLDKRAAKNGRPAPVKVRISHRGTMAMISTGVSVLPEQWNEETLHVVGHERRRALNAQLAALKADVDEVMFDLRRKGKLDTMTAAEIKKYYEGHFNIAHKTPETNFVEYFRKVMDSQVTQGSKDIFAATERRLRAFDAQLDERTFEDLNIDYMKDFDAFLSPTNTRNSRNVYFRTIRTCFNAAIGDDLTNAYPFRKFKLKQETTRDKALSVEDMRTLLAVPEDDWRREYVDMFLLMFLLIGINIGDLFALRRIQSGRIEYDRQKTHKHYSVAVLPEAAAIIDRYRGRRRLLAAADRYKEPHDYLHHMNDALKAVGLVYEPGKPPTGEAAFPHISSGYARTTWATIATELDIPRETISAALGHSVVDVTATYIRLAWRKKIDEANRKVADFVLYGKRPE